MNNVVAAVVLDGIATFELAVACEVFGMDRSELVDPWYELLVCAAEPPPLRATGGITIDTPHRLDAPVEGRHDHRPGVARRGRGAARAVLEALRREHARGARIMSVCSGAFVLAHAGLLDGRRATTHWKYAALMAERFPLIEVDPDVLYVIDGDVMTSAGTAGGHRPLPARRAPRPRRGRWPTPSPVAWSCHRTAPAGSPSTCRHRCRTPALRATRSAEVLDWAVGHLHLPLSVEQLAARATMSPRTFARRFAEVVGTTPHQWLVRQRVLHAQRLLEETALPGRAGGVGGRLRVGHRAAPALRTDRRHVPARLPPDLRGATGVVAGRPPVPAVRRPGDGGQRDPAWTGPPPEGTARRAAAIWRAWSSAWSA
jgi:transcriptional regulator GlxA family with amidase domain